MTAPGEPRGAARSSTSSLDRVDGRHQDEAAGESDEVGIGLGILLAAYGDALEAFEPGHRLGCGPGFGGQ
jgi:hypothetical protein